MTNTTPIPSVSVNYECNGKSTKSNELGLLLLYIRHLNGNFE